MSSRHNPRRRRSDHYCAGRGLTPLEILGQILRGLTGDMMRFNFSDCRSIPKITCVYRLTCAKTGESYVGATQNLYERMIPFRNSATSLKEKSRVSRAIRQHGPESFYVEILQQCSVTELNRLEREWWLKLAPELNSSFPAYSQKLKLQDPESSRPSGEVNVRALKSLLRSYGSESGLAHFLGVAKEIRRQMPGAEKPFGLTTEELTQLLMPESYGDRLRQRDVCKRLSKFIAIHMKRQRRLKTQVLPLPDQPSAA